MSPNGTWGMVPDVVAKCSGERQFIRPVLEESVCCVESACDGVARTAARRTLLCIVTTAATLGFMVEVRALTPEDWRLWREVRLAALSEAPGAFRSTLAYWSGDGDTESRWRARLRDVPLNLVALEDNSPIGQASGAVLDGGALSELISMWVAPAARGSGVADALVDAVAEWAQSLGASAVRTSVRRANERAIHFYLRAGFMPVDEPGDEPAELAMVRPLHP